MNFKRFLFLSLIVLLSACGDSPGARSSLAEPPAVGGPPLVRRLTESQYRASVADIFGADVPVVARFGRALRKEGLVAVGTSEAGITPFTMEQYDIAASGVADYIFSQEQRQRYLECDPEMATQFDDNCARDFLSHYGAQLFRRPLSSAQLQRYLSVAEQGTQKLGDFYKGLKYALIGLMTAPEFVLRIERTVAGENGLQQLDAWSKASRLSYFLTNTTPDEALLKAAESGQLDTPDGLAQQVDRLLMSDKFESALRAFFDDMLEFDLFADLAKDTAIYPAFNSQVVEDAQEQTLRTIAYHLLEQDGDYRELFTLRDTFLTRALGIVYRLPCLLYTSDAADE